MLADVDVDSDGEEEYGEEGEVDDGVEEYGGTAGVEAAELDHGAPPGDLHDQSRA